jgi:hypothetical protein
MLGFLSCDGSLDKNGSTISLQIQARDVIVLDWLEAELVELDVHVGRDERTIGPASYVRARCHDRALYERVLELFGSRLKSDRRWPSWATLEFLRGVWDADGHFSARRNSIEGEITHKSIEWLEGVGEFVSKNSGLPVRQIETRKRGNFRLGLSPNHCRWFRDDVYDELPYLMRKRNALIGFHEPGPGRWWHQSELDYLVEHFVPGTSSWRSIAEHLGRSSKSVSKKIWSLGLVNK